MSISPQAPLLRRHPSLRKVRALSQSIQDPVGSISLFRLRLAFPIQVQAVLFQALDAILWVSGQHVVRLRLLGNENGIQGLLVLDKGGLCIFDLSSSEHPLFAFQIHGRRGMVEYDDTDRVGLWLQPARRPNRNLWPWMEQCYPATEEEEFPSGAQVDRIWRAALASLNERMVWQERGETA